MRKWVLRALLLSLLLHGGLFVFFQVKQLETFTPVVVEPAPIRFVVNKVTIDPKLLQPLDDKRMTLPATVPNKTINVPVDKPQPKEISLKPQTSEVVSPLLTDTPKSSPLNWDTIAKSNAASAGRADKELGSMATAFLNNSVKAPRQPSITMPPGTKGGDAIGGTEGIPGRQSIDSALALAGTPLGANQPVAMPGGALFSHDESELRPEAQEALKKLGRLISLYPEALFVISGHTDWTGAADYNQRLSERRAEAVKEWLVGTLGIAPERIATIGRGSVEAIVEADRTVDEQQPNRRVEIVIKTRRR